MRSRSGRGTLGRWSHKGEGPDSGKFSGDGKQLGCGGVTGGEQEETDQVGVEPRPDSAEPCRPGSGFWVLV